MTDHNTRWPDYPLGFNRLILLDASYGFDETVVNTTRSRTVSFSPADAETIPRPRTPEVTRKNGPAGTELAAEGAKGFRLARAVTVSTPNGGWT
jgi:hypothetical protein